MIIKQGMTIVVLITPGNSYYGDYPNTWLINTQIGKSTGHNVIL